VEGGRWRVDFKSPIVEKVKNENIIMNCKNKKIKNKK